MTWTLKDMIRTLREEDSERCECGTLIELHRSLDKPKPIREERVKPIVPPPSIPWSIRGPNKTYDR